MKVLKIATAGSVDDGKSSLIGRLLYDTKSLTQDKIEAIEKSSKKKGYDYLDLSLATDGLVAEREQGITIDVAHIYFSTPNTSYVIADTPGHVEYTRNMVTGASQAQVAIILIDARKGVIEQTFRHFFINNLLLIKDVIVAVNKMDLVDFSEEVFNDIKNEIEKLAQKSVYLRQNLTFIPISALKGDNIVHKSKNTPWYTGSSILDRLEILGSKDLYEANFARFPIQMVVRPKKEEFHDFRGYAGKLYGAALNVGDEVAVLPSKTKTKIKEIYFFDKKYKTGKPGTSINVTLEDEVNISRGDLLVKSSQLPKESKNIIAKVCWMDAEPLVAGKKYLIQHGISRVLGKIDQIKSLIRTDFSGEDADPENLKLNDIGRVSIKMAKALYYDSFQENKATGSFIFIDPQTNHTAGVGFIQ